jgi:flagellar basal body-associated protein FliL
MGLFEILIILIIVVVLFLVAAGFVALFMFKRTLKMAMRLAIAGVLLFTFLFFSTLGIYLYFNWSPSSPSKNKPTNSKPKNSNGK